MKIDAAQDIRVWMPDNWRRSGAIDTALADALSSAYAWSLGALAAISALTVPAAIVLYRSYNPDRITRD